MKKPTTTLRVPVEAATLEDIARDFERRAAEAASFAARHRDDTTRFRAMAESRTWEQAARILRHVAKAK